MISFALFDVEGVATKTKEAKIVQKPQQKIFGIRFREVIFPCTLWIDYNWGSDICVIMTLIVN